MSSTVTKFLWETPGAGRLGRHVDHDPRSRAYAIAEADTATFRYVRWRRYGYALDQGNLGSCTGNAIAGVLNTAPFRRVGIPRLTEVDAVRLYSEATRLDGFPGVYPPNDTGSSGIAVAKAAKGEGRIGGYTHAFTVTAALSALQTSPIIIGISWYEGFDHPDATGFVKISGSVRGGHEVELNGYAPAEPGIVGDDDLLHAWNSWGSSWGYKGQFSFSVGDFARLLSEQGDATMPTPL